MYEQQGQCVTAILSQVLSTPCKFLSCVPNAVISGSYVPMLIRCALSASMVTTFLISYSQLESADGEERHKAFVG